jgi:hypothetical protein
MDLHNLGGFKTLINLMKDNHEPVRSHAMNVFAIVVQNNPKSQQWALELGALPILMNILESVSNDNKTIVVSQAEHAKAMYATSSLVRACTPATVSFIKEFKGVALLVKIVSSPDDTYGVVVKRKALFLMRYVFTTVPVIKITLAAQLVTSFLFAAGNKDVDIRETALHLLLEIVRDKNAFQKLDTALLETTVGTLETLMKTELLDEVSRELCDNVIKLCNGQTVVATMESLDDPKLISN